MQYFLYKLYFFATDAVAFSNAKFGSGIGSIYLDDVQCSGSETSLLSCTYDSNTADCSHSSDAGVRCQGIYLLCCIMYCSLILQLTPL